MKEHKQVLKALANQRRLVILRLFIDHKYLTVGEIARRIKLSFKSTSKHLAVLHAVGIVDKEQKGLSMMYQINGSLPKIAKRVLELL